MVARTMPRIVMANKAAGLHWFDPAVMECWDSKIENYVVEAGEAGTVFLMSERMEGEPRRYRPCLSLPSGAVFILMSLHDGATTRDMGVGLCDLAASWLRKDPDYRDARRRLVEIRAQV